MVLHVLRLANLFFFSARFNVYDSRNSLLFLLGIAMHNKKHVASTFINFSFRYDYKWLRGRCVSLVMSRECMQCRIIIQGKVCYHLWTWGFKLSPLTPHFRPAPAAQMHAIREHVSSGSEHTNAHTITGESINSTDALWHSFFICHKCTALHFIFLCVLLFN